MLEALDYTASFIKTLSYELISKSSLFISSLACLTLNTSNSFINIFFSKSDLSKNDYIKEIELDVKQKRIKNKSIKNLYELESDVKQKRIITNPYINVINNNNKTNKPSGLCPERDKSSALSINNISLSYKEYIYNINKKNSTELEDYDHYIEFK